MSDNNCFIISIKLLWNGETTAALGNIIEGHLDGELSERGFRQSQILSSDTGRAKYTTKEIIIYHQDTPIEFTSSLRERSLGIFEGKTLITLKNEALKKGVSLREYKPQGGESWDDVLERARLVLDELIVKYVKKDYTTNKVTLSNKSNLTNLQRQSSLPMHKSISQSFKRNNTISNTLNNQSISIPADQIINYNIELNDMKKTFSKIDIQKDDFMNINFDELFKNDNFIRRISKIYQGFKSDLNFPRVLLISHPGFIMELMNSIRIRKNIKPKFINDSKPSSLYVLKIYCSNCGSVCYSKDNNCQLQFDMIIYNNVDHLNILNEI